MGHFGQKIDFVAGIYSENLLRERHFIFFIDKLLIIVNILI